MKRHTVIDDDDRDVDRKSLGRPYLMSSNLDFFRQDGNQNDDGVEYKLNEHGLRCDDFLTETTGLHVIFAGCSNTYGLGTDIENIWTTKVYNKIKDSQKVSGYYNLGINGGTIIEIVFHVFRYIEKFGNPDAIFMLLPERDRDDEFFFDKYEEKYSDAFNLSVYHSLDLYCRSNGIKLISSTWVSDYTDLWDSFSNFKRHKEQAIGKILQGPKIRNQKTMFDDFSKTFKTFKKFDKNKILEDLYDYSINNPDDPNLYTAKDRGRHFGNAFHYAWSQQMYERFLNEKNN